jgi:hypothetical protein
VEKNELMVEKINHMQTGYNNLKTEKDQNKKRI